MKRYVNLMWVPLVLTFVACGSNPTTSSTGAASSVQTNTQVFSVRGVVRRLATDGKTVTIQHEEIPNYMPAMTMPFKAKEAKELTGLQAGDAVAFRMTVTDDESWIDQVQKISATEVKTLSTRPSVRLVRDVEPLEPGDFIPNYHFTNELGQAIALDEFKGKALALTFIFTRCPLPEFCPLMAQRFAEASKILTSTSNSPTNWHLLSISFDPHFDTPAVLKSYAQRYKYDPTRWSFVTGAMIDIDAITEQFDLPIIKQGDNWDHKLRTVVIDAAGRVQKIFVYNLWKTEDLVAEIVRAARVQTGLPGTQEIPATGKSIKP